LDNDGRVMDSKALRKRVFYGGVEPELRKEVIICVFATFSLKT
jgi:TBC1 domain family member 15